MTMQTSLSPAAPGANGGPGSSTSEAGAAVKEHAAQVAGAAKEQAATVADEALSQARDLVGEARSQVRQQVDTQRSRVSDLLREVSQDLEQMAERSDRNGVAADLVRQAAARARAGRGYLEGGGDLLADVRRFARRKPGSFLLGAVAAGILAGRIGRAAAAARPAGSTSGDPSASGPGEAAGQYSAQPGYPAPTAPQTAYPEPTYPQPTYPQAAPGQPGYVSGSAPEAFVEEGYRGETPLRDPQERL